MKKKLIVIVVSIVVILLGGLALWLFYFNKESDSERFNDEYSSVTRDNVFVYKNIDEIIKILEHGTGVVYLGFPECPWCEAYVFYLNEVAKENYVEKVYYYNIFEDRKNNTEGYKKIVNILSDYLQYDDDGNKRIYVPAVIGVNNGKIVFFDDETAWNTKGYETPQEYWNNEDLSGLKNRLSNMFELTSDNVCTSGCNE